MMLVEKTESALCLYHLFQNTFLESTCHHRKHPCVSVLRLDNNPIRYRHSCLNDSNLLLLALHLDSTFRTVLRCCLDSAVEFQLSVPRYHRVSSWNIFVEMIHGRSDERRVGKECRSRWS